MIHRPAVTVTVGIGATVAVVVLASGCADLPPISAGVCGNGVVEPPEDCDTFSPDSASVCLPRGTAGECHFDCRASAGGVRPACPAGWGCDTQGICRAPTGGYTALPEMNVGRAFSLLAGDFDGDGRDDVMSTELIDARGRSRLAFRYFDAGGAVADSRVFPKLVASPSVVDVSGDGRADVTFTTFSVGLLLGRADRSLVPETFNSYHFPDTTVRLLTANDEPVEDISAVVAVATIEGVPGLYLPDKSGILRLRGDLPGPPDTLMWNRLGGDVIVDPLASPCWELVLAARGATSFSLINTCSRPGDPNAAIEWRDQFIETVVALDPPAPIDAEPQTVDVDGDGHLDVLIGAGGRPYVAYGDGHVVGTAQPYILALADPDMVPPDIPMPLAMGDYTGDGLVDFVFPDYLLVSLASPGGGPPAYLPDHTNDGLPWTVARITDLNGDGRPDVVAASALRPGIDFFNGTGAPHLHAFSLPTDRPVTLLDIGDVDGDLIKDVAFVESMASDDKRDVVQMAFGAPAGPPETPVPVARINQVEDLSCLSELGLGNLIVASTEVNGGQKNGVLAILSGSGDRLPFAPYQLVYVRADRSVNQAAALAVQVGNFLGSGRSDVLALTSDGRPNDHDFHFWILPTFGAAQNVAVPLEGTIDDRLQPGLVEGFFTRVNLVGAAADLDGDGRDESLWAMPTGDGLGCGVVVVGAAVAAGQLPVLIPGETLLVDLPCAGPQLGVVDLDADGHPDVVLLTGKPGATDRKLLVFWNDGQGHLAGAAPVVVSDPGDSPQQFTVLPATALRKLALAYVTARAVRLREVTAQPRVLAPPRSLLELENGSGIVAADVNGDGVTDVVVATSGSLRVLRAELSAP